MRRTSDRVGPVGALQVLHLLRRHFFLRQPVCEPVDHAAAVFLPAFTRRSSGGRAWVLQRLPVAINTRCSPFSVLLRSGCWLLVAWGRRLAHGPEGSRPDSITRNGTELWFRGARNLDALLDDLIANQGLASARRVLLSGQSTRVRVNLFLDELLYAWLSTACTSHLTALGARLSLSPSLPPSLPLSLSLSLAMHVCARMCRLQGTRPVLRGCLSTRTRSTANCDWLRHGWKCSKHCPTPGSSWTSPALSTERAAPLVPWRARVSAARVDSHDLCTGHLCSRSARAALVLALTRRRRRSPLPPHQASPSQPVPIDDAVHELDPEPEPCLLGRAPSHRQLEVLLPAASKHLSPCHGCGCAHAIRLHNVWGVGRRAQPTPGALVARQQRPPSP